MNGATQRDYARHLAIQATSATRWRHSNVAGDALALRGAGLRAGEIVSLGSVIAAYDPQPRDDVRVEHDPLGELRPHFS
jgi:hypothetical protein